MVIFPSVALLIFTSSGANELLSIITHEFVMAAHYYQSVVKLLVE